jgi:hypothetical protein
MLFPGITPSVYAVFAMAVALPGIVRLARVWAPVWQRLFRDQRGQFWELLWLVASPAAVYAAMLLAAIGTQACATARWPTSSTTSAIAWRACSRSSCATRGSCLALQQTNAIIDPTTLLRDRAADIVWS